MSRLLLTPTCKKCAQIFLRSSMQCTSVSSMPMRLLRPSLISCMQTSRLHQSALVHKKKKSIHDEEDVEGSEEDYGIDEAMLANLKAVHETSQEATESSQSSTSSANSFETKYDNLTTTLSDKDLLQSKPPKASALLSIILATSNAEQAERILELMELYHSRQVTIRASAELREATMMTFVKRMCQFDRPEIAASAFLDLAKYGFRPTLKALRILIASLKDQIVRKQADGSVALASDESKSPSTLYDTMYLLLGSMQYYSLDMKDPSILASLLAAGKAVGGEEAAERILETAKEIKEVLTRQAVESLVNKDKKKQNDDTLEQDRQIIQEGLDAAADVIGESDREISAWCREIRFKI